MKQSFLCAIIIIVLLLSFFFFGCEEEMETVSIEERIDRFLANLNEDTNRTNTWEHLHPDTVQRDFYRDGAQWLATPFSQTYSNYSFTLTYGISSADGTMNATGGNPYDGDQIQFTMKEDETDVWHILQIVVDPGGTPFTIQ